MSHLKTYAIWPDDGEEWAPDQHEHPARTVEATSIDAAVCYALDEEVIDVSAVIVRDQAVIVRDPAGTYHRVETVRFVKVTSVAQTTLAKLTGCGK